MQMCHKPKAVVLWATKERPFSTKSTVTSLKGRVYIVTWSQNIKQKYILLLLPTSQHLHERRIQAPVRLQHKNTVGLLWIVVHELKLGRQEPAQPCVKNLQEKKVNSFTNRVANEPKFQGFGKENLTKKRYHFPSLQEHKASLPVTSWIFKILQDLNITRKQTLKVESLLNHTNWAWIIKLVSDAYRIYIWYIKYRRLSIWHRVYSLVLKNRLWTWVSVIQNKVFLDLHIIILIYPHSLLQYLETKPTCTPFNLIHDLRIHKHNFPSLQGFMVPSVMAEGNSGPAQGEKYLLLLLRLYLVG